MSFRGDVSKATKAMMEDAERFVRAVNFEIMTSVILDTPVGNPENWNVKYKPIDYVGGRLRGNWQTTEGAPATGQLDRIQDGASGGAIAEAERVLAKGFGVFWLSNNMPYAVPIEYDGHSHTQAPEGMLRKNVARVRQIVGRHKR